MEWEQNKFAERLETLLAERGKTQKEFARSIGVNPITFSNWKEKSEPKLTEILRIAEAFKVSPAYLTFGDTNLPMNEEEQTAVEYLRQCRASERASFVQMLATVAQRDAVIETAPRRKALPAGDGRLAANERAPYGEIVITEPVKKVKKVNRRDELATYTLETQGNPFACLRGYDGLAAGPGRALQRCDDDLFCPQIRNASNYTYARVAGDSMEETVRHGELIILQQFNPPFELEALDPDSIKNKVNRIRSDVPNDTIWIVQINGNDPTLKRIRYETRSGEENWTLMIEADNPNSWDPFPIKRTDNVVFWARLKGLASISTRG